MKICLFLLVLPFASIAQSAQQYLVTTSNDTIYYKGDLIVNNDDITQWRWVTADKTDYTILINFQISSFSIDFFFLVILTLLYFH